MTTKLDRDPAGSEGRGQAANSPASDELIDSVRGLVDRYCRARLAGYEGGAEAAEDVTREVCLAAAEALQTREDLGAPFAALVFSIAAHHVTEAQRRLDGRSSSAGPESSEETGTTPA